MRDAQFGLSAFHHSFSRCASIGTRSAGAVYASTPAAWQVSERSKTKFVENQGSAIAYYRG